MNVHGRHSENIGNGISLESIDCHKNPLSKNINEVLKPKEISAAREAFLGQASPQSMICYQELKMGSQAFTNEERKRGMEAALETLPSKARIEIQEYYSIKYPSQKPITKRKLTCLEPDLSPLINKAIDSRYKSCFLSKKDKNSE